VATAPVSATYLALVDVQLTAGTRVPGAGAVAVVKAAERVVLAGAVVKTRVVVACDVYLLRTVASRPRRQTQTEVRPGHVHAQTYIHTLTYIYTPTYI